MLGEAEPHDRLAESEVDGAAEPCVGEGEDVGQEERRVGKKRESALGGFPDHVPGDEWGTQRHVFVGRGHRRHRARPAELRGHERHEEDQAASVLAPRIGAGEIKAHELHRPGGTGAKPRQPRVGGLEDGQGEEDVRLGRFPRDALDVRGERVERAHGMELQLP